MAKQERDSEGLTQRDRANLSKAVLKIVASGKMPADQTAGAMRVAKDVLKRR